MKDLTNDIKKIQAKLDDNKRTADKIEANKKTAENDKAKLTDKQREIQADINKVDSKIADFVADLGKLSSENSLLMSEQESMLRKQAAIDNEPLDKAA